MLPFNFGGDNMFVKIFSTAEDYQIWLHRNAKVDVVSCVSFGHKLVVTYTTRGYL